MKIHQLSFWVYWIAVVSLIGLIGLGCPAEANISLDAARLPASPDVELTVPQIPPQPTQPTLPVLADDALGPVETTPSVDQVGIASWYGNQHQGRLTASGQRFDEQKLTAAHRTLPLDTKVKVTNLENGKSIEVKVNDRGPYIAGRVLDLSTRAAWALGMEKEGLALVRIEILPAQFAGTSFE
jgi:rare lipoprotein A